MALYNVFKKKFGDKVTNGWRAAHQAVDYPTPINFIVRAPDAGTYRHMPSQLSRTNPSAAGVWGELELDNGRRIRFCHLKKHIAKHNSRVVKGQALSRTGNTGFVIPRPTFWSPTAGAHMHTYGIYAASGRWDWTKGASATCSGVVNTKNGLRLRKEPNTKSKTILIVPDKTKLTARSFNKQWWKVTYKGKTGWVHAAYIK